MISGQVDRLRTAAQTYRRLGNHTAEGMFLEAADTICELQADNAKLRDGANAMRQLYEDELKHALTDNAMLREQLAKARDPQRIGGTADPESFVYAIEQLREFRWQHATNDEEAIPYINNVADAHERENAKLREQMERLVTLLRVDCDIDASWDGLRHFWSIELTEDGCLMRDRACKAEAENAKLREWCSDFWKWADPPFALKSGTFDEYMALAERAVELGVIK